MHRVLRLQRMEIAGETVLFRPVQAMGGQGTLPFKHHVLFSHDAALLVSLGFLWRRAREGVRRQEEKEEECGGQRRDEKREGRELVGRGGADIGRSRTGARGEMGGKGG